MSEHPYSPVCKCFDCDRKHSERLLYGPGGADGNGSEVGLFGQPTRPVSNTERREREKQAQNDPATNIVMAVIAGIIILVLIISM